MDGESAWIPPQEFDEYRLVRMLGRGAMGEVHLAHDRVLDRPVAIKFITALDTIAHERFLIEARAAARIHHPNVMAVFRVGVLDGHPYLIQEYVRGRSLVELELPIPWREALQLGVGLARGLAAAHRRGVLHRDIKLANAIIGDRGDVKLLDFGLAKLETGAAADEAPGASRAALRRPIELEDTRRVVGEPVVPRPPTVPPPGTEAVVARLGGLEIDPRHDVTERGVLLGTPNYMAPELWLAQPASRRSDVYAVGVLLYVLCCGHTPTEARELIELAMKVQEQEPAPLVERVPDIDPRFAAIVDRCIRRSPSERFASGEELRAALESLRPATRKGFIPAGNPYRGLRAFEEEHRDLFFGRTAEVQAILERLRSQPFVVVAGDSGVGKSSVCRAGVLPAVAEGVLDPSRTWVTRSITPGRRPAAALVHAVAGALAIDAEPLLEAVHADPDALERAVRRQQKSDRGCLVFLDQLEEVVTLARGDEASLVARLIGQIASGIPGLKLLASARGDFLTRLAQLPELAAELPGALYFLGRLSPEGVRQAIVGPAEAKRVQFESEALVEQLVAAGVEGSLPLLQFALAEIWEARPADSDVISAAAIDKLGGVPGALARHADAVIARLDPDQRRAARLLLLRLVTLESTRASLTREELVGDEPAARAALEAMLAGRLLVVREHTGGFVYELAHEALIQGWTSLQLWLEEEAESRQVRHRLEAAVEAWERLDRPRELLWHERQLAELRVVERASLRPRELAFVGASEARARRGRQLRRFAALAVPALLLLTYAGVQAARRRAVDQQVEAHARAAGELVERARARDAEVLRDRAAAFASFDAGDVAAGEATWRAALAGEDDVDDFYNRAGRELEMALRLAPQRDDLQRDLAELLHVQAELAERAHHGRRAADLIARVALYDVDDTVVRRWHAPARVALELSPSGASASIAAYERAPDGHLRLGEPRYLGHAPLDVLELAPGSYLLLLTAEGRAPLRYPLLLARGEALHLPLALPPAEQVPDGFVYVAPGRFLHGSAAAEDFRRSFLGAPPLHERRTDAFLIARHETTYAEWIEFLDALADDQRAARLRISERAMFRPAPALVRERDGGWSIRVQLGEAQHEARAREPLRLPARARRAAQDWLRLPVTGLDRDDADAYLRWLDATGRVPGARLCHELEWERAARGADARKFATGDDVAPDDANFDETYGREFAAMGPDEVGSHPASESPFGVHDTMGNVWEWVTSATGSESVARGGAYFFDKLTGSATNRNVLDRQFRDGTLGLRVCASPRTRRAAAPASPPSPPGD